MRLSWLLHSYQRKSWSRSGSEVQLAWQFREEPSMHLLADTECASFAFPVHEHLEDNRFFVS